MPPEQFWQDRRSEISEQVTRPNEDRSPYDRDRARIIHSAAFRRLQAKTQVLGINEGDFHRTRLTHSMEVAQIATGIGARFRLNRAYKDVSEWLPERELLEAICFAHDLGHPPFGHGGERALNNALLTSPAAKEGMVGFEGNGQTLRLLTSLEAHTPGHGLDLTRRTLLGVLKYPVPYSQVVNRVKRELKPLFLVEWKKWKPPKCYLDTEAAVVAWILEPLDQKDRDRFVQFEGVSDASHGKPRYKSLDCSIMDVADEIAYGVHDFEDGVALRLITQGDWQGQVKPNYDSGWASSVKLPPEQELAERIFAEGPGSSATRKRAVGAMVNALISSVKLEQYGAFRHPLLDLHAAFDPPAKAFQAALQDVILTKIISTPCVQTLEHRGQLNLLALFRAIETDPTSFLSGEFRDKVEKAPVETLRVIADYISGMTDEYATRMFERMFVPRHGTVFDRL